jgi:adenylosuccinate synthase
VNSYTEINLTKLDILDTFPEIKVAVNYKDPQTKDVIHGFPADLSVVENLDVDYVTMEGWMTPIGACKSFDELPKAVGVSREMSKRLADCSLQCKTYIEFIEKEVGVKSKFTLYLSYG